MKRITHVTGIPEGVLSGDGELETTSFSVATRMTWASRRSTTKKEDRAYSLMGIFGITLPIIYGGSENVFVKFQKEIMKRHPDQSIFAWTAESAPPTATAGLLTPTPAYFADVDEISDEVFVKDFAHMIKPDSHPPAHYTHTNLGIQITLPMKRVEGRDDLFLAMLRCALLDKPDRPLCIYLRRLTGTRNQWVRTRIGELIPVPRDDKLFENTQIFIKEDMSFFEPPKPKRAVSTDTYVPPSSREQAPRLFSVAPAPKRQAIQGSLVVPEAAQPSAPSTNTPHHQPTPRVDHQSTPSHPGDARREHPSPIPVTEDSRVPVNSPVEESAAPEVPLPTTNTHCHPRAHRVDHRPTPSRSGDARRERPSPILVPEAEQTVSSQEMLTTIPPFPLPSRGHLNGFVN
ncbi:hypothetical protein BU15DRAFT_83780 [Melanogaster broomeanus]|nr:hypothetical protein BU15DRAFT_83780 [Melanogaster broomeanus]